MHTVNVLPIIGVGFLAIGAMFCVTDLMLFDNSYVPLMGPISWIVGCAVMIAWALERLAIVVNRDSEAQKRETPTSSAAATGFRRRAAV